VIEEEWVKEHGEKIFLGGGSPSNGVKFTRGGCRNTASRCKASLRRQRQGFCPIVVMVVCVLVRLWKANARTGVKRKEE
jgi:hypothetical protein